ncbi:MAG: hypothetical protein JNL08_13045 [Planctomycetes bacterium]|nr:hypothetical protein [Planctomycetota bacterium]
MRTSLRLLALATAATAVLPAQSLLADIRPGAGSSNPGNLTRMGGAVYFIAETPATGFELWRTDGTTAGTTMVADINPTPGAGALATVNRVPELFAFGSTLLFWANDGTHGQELWRSDGTAAGTQLVLDIEPGPNGSDPFDFTASGNRVFFYAAASATGRELWVTDGTTGGTHLVADFYPGAPGGSSTVLQGSGSIAAFGTGVLFSGRTGFASNQVLCFSDGSAGGTNVVDAGAFDPRGLTPLGSGFTCSVFSPATGVEPWFTNGSDAGTFPLGDLAVGSTSSLGTNLLTVFRPQLLGGRHWFVASASTFGLSLWSTDGTPSGTSVFFAPQVSDPLAQVRTVRVAGDRLYLEVSSTTLGSELHVTDGIATPSLVVDLNPGTGTGWPSFGSFLAPGQGRLAITTMRPTDVIADEPAVTDGTPAGTHVLANLATGNFAGSNPREYTRLGDKVLFVAQDDGFTGRELYVLDIAALGVADAVGYGTGCAGTGGLVPDLTAVGAPRLGNSSFAVRLTDGLPNALAVQFFDFAPAAVPLGPCTLLIQNLTIEMVGVTDASGVFQLPLPLVGSPIFLGLEFWGQGLVLDGNGLLFGGLGSLTDGLRVRVGR